MTDKEKLELIGKIVQDTIEYDETTDVAFKVVEVVQTIVLFGNDHEVQ